MNNQSSGLLLSLVLLTGSACLQHSGWNLQPEGRMHAPAISESSGVGASFRFPGVLWTHNDSNNAPQLFAIRRNGELIRAYSVAGAENHDWEDIAADSEGNLFVLDNTSRLDPDQRSFVYIFSEPDPLVDKSLKLSRKIPVRFPDGSFDCETLMVWKNSLYLVTKPWDGKLPRVYRLDDLDVGGTASYVGTVPVQAMITGGDISADGTRIALSSYRALLIFQGFGPPEVLFRSEPVMCPLNARQVEAIAWSGEDLIMTNEQREVYHISRSEWERQQAPFLRSPQKSVPFLPRPPQIDQRLTSWKRGGWLEAHYDGKLGKLGRVAWSPAGLHFGINLPPGVRLAELPQRHPDFDDWFRPGSLYVMINPDGARPVVYGQNDRCICMGRLPSGKAAAHIHLLRPGTVVEWTQDTPEWVHIEENGQRLLVTLTPQAAGMEKLEEDMTLGFNLLIIMPDGKMISWATLSRRFSWDAPSTWGLLKLDD